MGFVVADWRRTVAKGNGESRGGRALNTEALSFGATIAVLVLQGLNLYITVNMKLWTTNNFVRKDDLAHLCPVRAHYEHEHR